MIIKPKNRDEWLAMRHIGIGGSDAGSILGVNKYRSNIDLWREKTGEYIPEDISDKPAVIFGKLAEDPLRELFKLDFPQYKVDYHEFYMYCNDEYPFIFATLDGEIIDENAKRGVFENKTCTIQNPSQWHEWEDKIPDSYYVQLLHQLAATGWDFAILKAYIRYYRDDVLRATIRHYRVDRDDVKDDIDYLIREEVKFWECVKTKTKPALILPGI